MKNPVQALKSLYLETVAVLKKCTWPTKQELRGETLAVITFVIISTIFLFVADQIFVNAIKYICM